MVRRVAVPLQCLVGARVLALDFVRPNADLPCAEGEVPIHEVGQPGEDGRRTATGTAACKDTAIEPLGVLVLEFAFDAAGADGGVAGTSTRRPFFSATRVSAVHKDARRRVATEDFSGGGVASATRHYIVADASECLEVANFLVLKSPAARAVAACNSLGGEYAVLAPGRTACLPPRGPLDAAAGPAGGAAVPKSKRARPNHQPEPHPPTPPQWGAGRRSSPPATRCTRSCAARAAPTRRGPTPA